MGLFTPAYLSDSRNRALPAVEKLKSPEKLLQAAIQSPITDVQRVAVSKLTGQAQLLQVAVCPNCKCVPDVLAKLDSTGSIAFIRQATCPQEVCLALEKVSDAEFLMQLAQTAADRAVRAKAIEKIPDEELDTAFLMQIALHAVGTEKNEAITDGYAAVRRLGEDDLLLTVTREAADRRVAAVAAGCIKDPDTLAEYLIETSDKANFIRLAPGIRDSALIKKITEQAKIRDKAALDTLLTPEQLLEKALKNKAPKLVEKVYETTFDAEKLTALCVICTDELLQQALHQRIKIAEGLALLRQKGCPQLPAEEINRYLKALAGQLQLLKTVKQTLHSQGREIAFDAIYEQYGDALEKVISDRCGLSVTWFLGGYAVGKAAISGPGIRLSAVAEKAVWVAVAALQLADLPAVTDRLCADMPREAAAKLLQDILRTQYEQISG